MYHNFFTHSPFHVPAIVNSAAMNIGVHVTLSILASAGYMSSSGIAGPLCILIDKKNTVY